MSCYRISARAVPSDDVVESMEHLHLDPAPRVVGIARSFIREQSPDLPDELLDVILLLTSELVTNAVIHARTAIEVGMTVTNRSLIVTVHDEDLNNRTPNRARGREGGWGLGLVRDLAEDFEMEHHPGEGKTAWFRVSREAKAS
jgi:anti-sigma regulatory factor (Ser/Thr protein kinase)